MPQRRNAINNEGSCVTIGATGTIGSLMTRELDSMKHHPQQASSSAPRKQQTGPVSVPCGASPRKALQKRNHTNEHGGSSNDGRSNGHRHGPGDVQRHRHMARRKGYKTPMLVVSDESPKDRNLEIEKGEKKAHNHIVQVVDLKCSNPMSGRLKKLSFSKLSESIS